MENKKSSLDDLIGTSGNENIVVGNRGDDKKFLYTLLIILAILFIIAIGVIAFLSGKYFSNNSNNRVNNQAVAQPAQKQPMQNSAQQSPVAKPASSSAKTVDNSTLNELESLVKSQAPKKEPVKTEPTKQEKAIAKVASAASGGKSLSQEDLAKIARMVAMELAKSNKNSSSAKSSTKNADSALVAQLEQSNADTLKSQSINESNLKDAKANASAKKVDTFNKVVVKQNNNNNDELAKLSSEIDAILQTEEVKKTESSYKYKKEIAQSAKERANESRFIVVKRGDTLGSLAYKAYGRASAYKKIYEANPDLVKNPNRIYVGMKLRVPVDEEYIKQQGK